MAVSTFLQSLGVHTKRMSRNDETDQRDVSNCITTSSDQNMFCFPNKNKLQLNNGYNKTTSGIVVINDLERSMSLVSWKEMKVQACLAGPLIMGNLLSFLLQMLSLTFVGHCGDLELSGAAIANSFATVTGFSVVLGMGSALDTLCGQAYGAGQYEKLGIYLQRAIFVLNTTSIPLALIWANMETLLVLLGQDAQIASKAGTYAKWIIPTLFASSTSQPFVKFLQAQSVVSPLFFIYMCTLVLHVPICWFMVFRSGMGYVGAALANSISYWLNVLLISLYVKFSSNFAKTRAPLSRKALQDLGGFFRLAIPSAAMLCLEWWSYEILVILSGLLSNPELQTATISICVSTASLIFTIPMGFGAVASTRVANELGAGNPWAARAVVSAALALTFNMAMLVACFLLLVRNVWGLVYSNDEEVIDTLKGLIPLVAMSTTVDAMQGVLSGVSRGAGWQKCGAFINLVSFYVIGLPVGCVLAFLSHLQGKGLWLGLTIGASVQLVSFLIIITRFTDWKKEAEKAVLRMSSPYTSANEALLSIDK